MTAPIVPGQVWLDDRDDVESHLRRVVEVTEVDSSYIHGVGWWQTCLPSRLGWRDETWPGNRRRTRVLVAAFRRRYVLLESATAEPPVDGGAR